MDEIFEDNTIEVKVDLDKELVKHLDQLANDSMISRSDIIRGFLQERVNEILEMDSNCG